MSSLIVIALLILATFAFMYVMYEKIQQAQTATLREVVRALKSQTVVEYNESLPAEGDMPGQEEEDEMIDLDQVEPEALLKIIKKDASH